jgi:hypothetical protein
MLDHNTLIDTRRQMLLEEASMERLAALLPRHASGVRHDLATACLRLAAWLDTDRTVPVSESGFAA